MQSVIQLCSDPRKTRDRAEVGEAVPCYRCLAFEPDTKTGCRFLERGSITPRVRGPEVSTEQLLLPESDTIERDT